MILATDLRYGIGYKNQLPWNIPLDIKLFRSATTGHSVAMGRKTFESLGNKPLPKRKNYVVVTSSSISSKENYDNVSVVSDINELISKYKDSNDILFIIGGKRMFESFAPHAEEIIWSKMHNNYLTDVKIDKSIFDNFIVKYRKRISKEFSAIYMVRFI